MPQDTVWGRIRLQHTVGGQAGSLNSICLLFSYLALSWAQSDSFVGNIAFQSLGGRSSAVVLCTQAANPAAEPRTNPHVSTIPPGEWAGGVLFNQGGPNPGRIAIKCHQIPVPGPAMAFPTQGPALGWFPRICCGLAEYNWGLAEYNWDLAEYNCGLSSPGADFGRGFTNIF